MEARFSVRVSVRVTVEEEVTVRVRVGALLVRFQDGTRGIVRLRKR